MRFTARRRLAALGLALFGACQSARPTEFVNVTFTPSVDTDDYATWDFELDACRDFGDPRVDDAFLREHLLDAIEEGLQERGYRRRVGEPVDFTVFYELWLTGGGDLAGVQERGRGRILVRDVASGRLVWRGERKAPVGGAATPEQQAGKIRRFARELLQYTRKLEEPEEQD